VTAADGWQPPGTAARTEPAAATTLLGQLQRGLGQGFVAALAAGAAAHDAVIEGVGRPATGEPTACFVRYFAELVLTLAVPIDGLIAVAAADGSLAPAVLAGTWRLGHADVRRLLQDPATPEPLLARIVGELWARGWATRTELPPPAARLWLQFALDEADSAAARRPPLSPADYDSLAVQQLLELGRDVRHEQTYTLFAALRRQDGEPLRQALAHEVQHGLVFGKARLAARVLGALGDERLLPLAIELFGRADDARGHGPRLAGYDRMRRSCLQSYVCQLPPLRALQLARAWRGRGGCFEVVAGAVLAEFAEGDDRLALERLVARHLGADDGFDLLHELEALGKLGDARSAPLLIEVAGQTVSPAVRCRALLALAAMANAPGAAAVLRLALWDADDEAAVVACGVPVRGGDAAARHRLTALAGHALAGERLRAAATAANLRHR